MVACLSIACLASACSSGSSSDNSPKSKLAKIIPAGAGLIGGTAPTSDDRTWVLAGTPQVKTINQIDLRTGRQLSAVPESASASAIAISVNGVVCVGLRTKRAGAIEFHNGTTGALLSTTPVAAPVIDVTAGDDGTTFYVLYGRHGVFTAAAVDAQTGTIQVTLPVLKNAVAIVPTPAQQALYVLSGSGIVDMVSTSDGHRIAEFPVASAGIDVAIAPSGKILYLLAGSAAAPSISIIDLVKETQVGITPAAANSVAIEPGLDDSHVYNFVGTSAVGNIQLIKLTGV